MPFRLVLVLGWFLFPSVILAVCDFRPVFSHSFRVTAFDVELEDDDLWLTTAYGVELYNSRSDPPMLLASLALPGVTTTIAPAGRFVYAGSGSALFVIARGSSLENVFSVDLAAPINDLLLLSRYLYAATSDGVIQLDLLIPDRPIVSARLSTSTGAAFSLAQMGSHLYAADGDGSVEVYTIQIPELPQRIGPVSSLPRTVAVHAGSDFLYTSDGQQTEVFSGSGSGMSRIDLVPAAALAFHAETPEVFFGSGLDRRIRMFDGATRSILFDAVLPVTLGNVNRIHALAGTAGRLYVAAGDLGLVTYDISKIRPPFLMRVYPFGRVVSVVETGDTIYASFESGGIRRFRRQDGILTQQLHWDESRVSIVHDAIGSMLLSSSGNSLTLRIFFDTTSSTSTSVSFANAIRSGVLRERVATVLLADRSVWRVDFAAATPAPAPVPVEGTRPWFIARADSGIALADLDEENGTTTIRYYAGGDLMSTPQTATIEGAATSGIALSATGVAAAATFRGVMLVDFSANSTAVLPQTNTATRDLDISGDDLFVLTPDRLQVWSVSARALKREVDLPGDALSADQDQDEVTIATAEGLITVDPTTESEPPELLSNPAANSYHRKLVGAGHYLYLLDGRNVDIYFVLDSGVAIHHRRISFGGTLVDLAAGEDRFFTLSSGGKVSAIRRDGTIGAEYQISEGGAVLPLALRVLRGALYVAISKGCPAACEKKTLILDPGNELVQTSSLPGGLLDGSVEQNLAYALFDLPREIRALNVADPYRPVVTASRGSEGEPVSIAFSAARQTVYTLGEKLYAYNIPSLSRIGEQFSSYSDPSGRLSYLDQAVRIVSPDCAVIAGREANPRLLRMMSANVWQQSSTPLVPSIGRAIAWRDGMIFVLSDHSVEVWSSLPPPPRQRGVRH